MKKVELESVCVYQPTDKFYEVSIDIYQKEDPLNKKILIFNCQNNSLFEVHGPATLSWQYLNQGCSYNTIVLKLCELFGQEINVICDSVNKFFKELTDLALIAEKTH